jgi:nucleotide-binding universal stress UspA family protein
VADEVFRNDSYGHSRARQLVMGGVTSHIIKNAEMPIILAH